MLPIKTTHGLRNRFSPLESTGIRGRVVQVLAGEELANVSWATPIEIHHLLRAPSFRARPADARRKGCRASGVEDLLAQAPGPISTR
jgi:hypothetical protein